MSCICVSDVFYLRNMSGDRAGWLAVVAWGGVRVCCGVEDQTGWSVDHCNDSVLLEVEHQCGVWREIAPQKRRGADEERRPRMTKDDRLRTPTFIITATQSPFTNKTG